MKGLKAPAFQREHSALQNMKFEIEKEKFQISSF
jgi:hypothetical protein